MPDKLDTMEALTRTRLLLGGEAIRKLRAARVAVFGLGGVGGYVCEALARSGVGAFDLVDNDKICLSNLNRQIIATHKTLGQYKVEAMRERILDICPETDVRTYPCFVLPENAGMFPFAEYDYVVDAVDTVSAKITLILHAQREGVPVISCMGAGNKLDPSRLRVADIYQTKVCPLARVMRRELRRRGVTALKVVYSEEPPIRPAEDLSAAHADCPPETDKADGMPVQRRAVPGSVAFVPSVAGLLLAGEVIRELAGT